MAEGMKLKNRRGFPLGTGIKGINVPEELRKKVKTCIPFVDEALGGEGCTKTMTVMVTGTPGAGKSTLLRMLANSIKKSGHIALYNTGEESLYQAKMACERLFGTGLDDFPVGEEHMLPKIIEYLDSIKAAARKAGKQIFYLQDSMQTLDDGKYTTADGKSRGTTSKTPVHCTEAIVDWMQDNFGICFFVNQVTKGGSFKGDNTIFHAIDAHMHLFYDEKEKSDTFGHLLLEVDKNRWGCNGKTMVLAMTEKGLEERGHFFKPGMTPPPKKDEEEDDAA